MKVVCDFYNSGEKQSYNDETLHSLEDKYMSETVALNNHTIKLLCIILVLQKC